MKSAGISGSDKPKAASGRLSSHGGLINLRRSPYGQTPTEISHLRSTIFSTPTYSPALSRTKYLPAAQPDVSRKIVGRQGREVEKGENSIRRGGRGENSPLNREEKLAGGREVGIQAIRRQQTAFGIKRGVIQGKQKISEPLRAQRGETNYYKHDLAAKGLLRYGVGPPSRMPCIKFIFFRFYLTLGILFIILGENASFKRWRRSCAGLICCVRSCPPQADVT